MQSLQPVQRSMSQLPTQHFLLQQCLSQEHMVARMAPVLMQRSKALRRTCCQLCTTQAMKQAMRLGLRGHAKRCPAGLLSLLKLQVGAPSTKAAASTHCLLQPCSHPNISRRVPRHQLLRLSCSHNHNRKPTDNTWILDTTGASRLHQLQRQHSQQAMLQHTGMSYRQPVHCPATLSEQPTGPRRTPTPPPTHQQRRSSSVRQHTRGPLSA